MPDHTDPAANTAASSTSRISKQTAASRQLTRRLLMQTLYSAQLQNQLDKQYLPDLQRFVAQNPHTSADYLKADQLYFNDLLRDAVNQHATLQAAIDPLLDRPFVQLDPVERSILYSAAAELTSKLETPYKVIINEAVELAKKYGAEQSHKFINGVLDRYANDVRRFEKQA